MKKISIIIEIGRNHNGSVYFAKKIVKLVKKDFLLKKINF